jgi:hypothetical protein
MECATFFRGNRYWLIQLSGDDGRVLEKLGYGCRSFFVRDVQLAHSCATKAILKKLRRRPILRVPQTIMRAVSRVGIGFSMLIPWLTGAAGSAGMKVRNRGSQLS